MAAPTTYDDAQVYAKYLKKKCIDESRSQNCGCEGACSCNKDCDCCPVGTLMFIDDLGKRGCVSANDFDLLTRRTRDCGDGFGLIVNNSTGEVIGCFSEANFASVYVIVNPPA